MNTAETLYRLHSLLPLKKRQQGLSQAEAELHRAILRSFAERGRPPTRTKIARSWGAVDADDILSRLRDNDLVMLNERGEVSGAYPFTMERYVLIGNGRQHRSRMNLNPKRRS